MNVVEKRLTFRLSDADEFFFIYKMLHTNHPKIDLMIISQICVRVIHNMHVRLSFRCEVYMNLKHTAEQFQLSAL